MQHRRVAFALSAALLLMLHAVPVQADGGGVLIASRLEPVWSGLFKFSARVRSGGAPISGAEYRVDGETGLLWPADGAFGGSEAVVESYVQSRGLPSAVAVRILVSGVWGPWQAASPAPAQVGADPGCSPGPDPPGPSGWFPGPVTLDCSDLVTLSGAGSLEYRVDSGEWVAAEESFIVADEGLHTVDVQPVLSSGDRGLPVTLTVAVDATPPEIAADDLSALLVAPDGGFVVHFRAQDDLSGVGVVTAHLEDGRAVRSGSELNPGLPGPGRHTVTVEARDGAGNQASLAISFWVPLDPRALSVADGYLSPPVLIPAE